MIGRVLGNRYEIIELIGKGGMAFVYKARCSFLDRAVAVKVLQPQFAGDADFVRRFRREAQAAASLSHPNIVSIYDVGQEDGQQYIVMEHIGGKTLKDKIRSEAPLPAQQAVEIAVQIGKALEHAHANDIVHCDIKPHNILMTKEGQVKVTDFGLARAVSSSTLTYRESIIGSVHYFSPEQAHGELANKQSDLYSLGIVLYEMTTGRLPFEGESPITIALKHIQAKVESPQKMNPNTPPGLERIILKATEKEPADRYQSATEMLRDLQALSEDPNFLPADVPGDDSPTQVLPAVGPRAIDRQTRKREDGGENGTAENKGLSPRARTVRIAAILALFALVIFGAVQLRSFFNVPIVSAPNLIGKSLGVAEKEMAQSNLRYRVMDEVYSELPANFVVSQDPKPEEQMKVTLPISLVLSKGPELVPLPNLIGMRREEAELSIINGGLSLGVVTQEHNPDVEAGQVMDQNPRADILQVKKGAVVDLVVSSGPVPANVVMPDFVGAYLDNVLERLTDIKLLAGTAYEDAASQYPAGMVIRQVPQIGSAVAEGAKVDLTVSRRTGKVTGPTRRKTLQIDVPASGPSVQQVRVEMIDAERSRTLDISNHAPGDSYNIPVEWLGKKAIIKVYINGSFREMREIE